MIHFRESIWNTSFLRWEILIFIGISYAFSVNRRAVCWRIVAWGLGLEFALALVDISEKES